LIVPFPWPRFWRRVTVIFVIALVISLAVSAAIGHGSLDLFGILVAVVDSAVLAVVLAFPLTQRVYHGPRR